MKKVKSFMLPYHAPSYGVAIFSFLLAAAFCIAFFVLLQDLPALVPVHWSAQGGFDNVSPKSELYPIAIIPAAVAACACALSIYLIRKDIALLANIASGIALCLTAAMIFVGAFMLHGITQIAA